MCIIVGVGVRLCVSHDPQVAKLSQTIQHIWTAEELTRQMQWGQVPTHFVKRLCEHAYVSCVLKVSVVVTRTTTLDTLFFL